MPPLLSLLLLAAVGLGACGGDDECGDLSNVTYRSHAQFVVARHCVECHDVNKTGAQRRSAPESHNYNTFADVSKFADRMADRINDNTMPPSAPVPRCDKLIFDAWIKAGKPER